MGFQRNRVGRNGSEPLRVKELPTYLCFLGANWHASADGEAVQVYILQHFSSDSTLPPQLFQCTLFWEAYPIITGWLWHLNSHRLIFWMDRLNLYLSLLRAPFLLVAKRPLNISLCAFAPIAPAESQRLYLKIFYSQTYVKSYRNLIMDACNSF